jgi:dienelactone hydrolase
MYLSLAALLASVLILVPRTAAGQRLVAPASALMDEMLHVRISGLRPGQRVALRASMSDTARRTWRAETVFVADSGSEISVDAMGLVTSMDLPEQPGAAVYSPPGLDSVPLAFALIADGRTIDSAMVLRRFLALGVRAAPVRERNGPIGTFFSPARSGRAPAILVLGGSEGGNSAADVAAQLAAHGYATLSLAYFGVEPLPRELDEIPTEYFERAITYLLRQPGVDSTAIALFGTSKGAEAALLVAAHDPRVRAVVAYAPSSVVWSCICASPSHSSWSLRGKGVPSVPPGRDPSVATVVGEPQRPAVHYRYRMRNLEAVATAIIPVERINGPVMLVAGDADELWPSGEMARQLRARRAAVPGRAGDTIVIYPEAGHRIGKSYLPAGSTRVAGGRLETGGSARANAAAQADAWPRVLRFLSTVFQRR